MVSIQEVLYSGIVPKPKLWYPAIPTASIHIYVHKPSLNELKHQCSDLSCWSFWSVKAFFNRSNSTWRTETFIWAFIRELLSSSLSCRVTQKLMGPQIFQFGFSVTIKGLHGTAVYTENKLFLPACKISQLEIYTDCSIPLQHYYLALVS